MSGESGQLEWQSIDPSRVIPDMLSRFKSYQEIDDDTSPLVIPQALPAQTRDDAAAPYFNSSVTEEAEEFSSSSISSFLPSEASQSRDSGLSTPIFMSVISNQPSPVVSSTSPFFSTDVTQNEERGFPSQSENIPSHPGGFLNTKEDNSTTRVGSISFLPSERRRTSRDVTISPRVSIPNERVEVGHSLSVNSDISANDGNYFREYLNSSGFSRLSETVHVDKHVSPVDNVAQSSPEECETEKSPTEFVILAEKYILMGALDPTTIFAVHKDTREYFHLKSVPVRSSHEVVCQHALLQDYSGVRSPVEVVSSADGTKSWLVFPPHFGDLHSYVRRRRRLREAEAQRLLNQIVCILDKCHEAGLVLRDLKLRKFVFSDSSRQEIMLESLEDSVFTGENDILHDKHGCPAYVAPEILTLSNFSGRLADMWGLGVILYTMLVGKYPFHNADTATLFAKIRNGKYSIPEWVSTRARHLILSLLRRQPNRRLSTKQVLCHPWLIRPPREHWTRDTMDHAVPSELSKVLILGKKI